MNLKYKPENGFEIDKLVLLQKNGKYYYQYKANDEIFEETINKSIYEKIKHEKELVLSLKNPFINGNFKIYPFKLVNYFLVFYAYLCFTGALAALPLTLIYNTTTFLIMFFYLFFQSILTCIASSSLDKTIEDMSGDVLKPIKEKIETIDFFNVEKIKTKLNYKINKLKKEI